MQFLKLPQIELSYNNGYIREHNDNEKHLSIDVPRRINALSVLLLETSDATISCRLTVLSQDSSLILQTINNLNLVIV